MSYTKDQQIEMQTYFQSVLDALDESGADIDENDPGYPDYVLTNSLPDGAYAEYRPPNPEAPHGRIVVSMQMLEHSLQTQEPFELVNALVHERRHFKQDCAGALDKESLPPPASTRNVVLQEVDAFTYTAGVIDKLEQDEKTQWLTARENAPMSMLVLAQMAYGQAKEAGLDPDLTLARTLMYAPEVDFIWEYTNPELLGKLAHVQAYADGGPQLSSLSKFVWPQNLGKPDSDPGIHEFYRQSRFFEDDEGNHEWLMKDSFLPGVMGKHAEAFKAILADIQETHARISPELYTKASSENGQDDWRNDGGMA